MATLSKPMANSMHKALLNLLFKSTKSKVISGSVLVIVLFLLKIRFTKG